MSSTKRVSYKKGSFRLIPPLHSYDHKLVGLSNPNDTHTHKLQKSVYTPPKFFCDPKKIVPFHSHIEHRQFKFYDVETKLIWMAFDTPEKISVLFNDYCLRGYPEIYESGSAWVNRALHWVREARFWRSIGIHAPFYQRDKLRIHCFQEGETGVLRYSTAMLHAVMDLERALKRKNLGLPPNYVWDNWGPSGFIDGRQTEYLPRMFNAPIFDSDGVDVEEAEVLPFVTEDALKERYHYFIFPNESPLDYEGAFLRVPSHANCNLADLDKRALRLYFDLYHTIQGEDSQSPPAQEAAAAAAGEEAEGLEGASSEEEAVQQEGEGEEQHEQPEGESHPAQVTSATYTSTGAPNLKQGVHQRDPNEMRALFYLSADPSLLDQLGSTPTSWAEVEAFVTPLRSENDIKVDAARMLYNTGRSVEHCRRFYEEKCGWGSFIHTPDKVITAGVMAYLSDVQQLLDEHGDAWSKELCLAQTDAERKLVMGERAFGVFRHIEDLALEKRRKDWATRFSGEAQEEATLDYMLKNFAKRTEQGQTRAAAYGEEYDRELEPVGRNTQRRVLGSDVALTGKANQSKQRKPKVDLFDGLDAMQKGSSY